MSDKFDIKTPKGTRDYGPIESAIRERGIELIKGIFRNYGAVTIDTPVFELKEVLMNKYGEDSKLIFDLQDQGGELCSLRYDLTVPFARFLAMNKDIRNIKRYHIGKVYRRDQPIMTRGRYREFYQCDFDIAGTYEPLLADAEIIAVMNDIFNRLDIGRVIIKINHRMLLDGIFEVCGVPPALFRTVCSSIDKLDKQPWSEVRSELIESKGIESQVADLIGGYVSRRGNPASILAQLAGDPLLSSNSLAKAGIDELELLFSYVQMMIPNFSSDSITIDLSLARGLDYYTGMITEAVLEDNKFNIVGSVAGGGRYDNLVNNFTGSSYSIPCVGMSIGIERIFSILEAKDNEQAAKKHPTQVLVASLGGDPLLGERFKICYLLRQQNIQTETLLKLRTKMSEVFEYAEKHEVVLVILVGTDEIANGQVRVKFVEKKHNQDPKGKLLAIEDIPFEIERMLRSVSPGQ